VRTASWTNLSSSFDKWIVMIQFLLRFPGYHSHPALPTPLLCQRLGDPQLLRSGVQWVTILQARASVMMVSSGGSAPLAAPDLPAF
jgi:hypothetical protein